MPGIVLDFFTLLHLFSHLILIASKVSWMFPQFTSKEWGCRCMNEPDSRPTLQL